MSRSQAKTIHKPSGGLHAIALACAAASVLATATAQVQAQTHTGSNTASAIKLPAQPLQERLNALSRQFGVAIGGDASLLTGKTAPATEGNQTLPQALDAALAGSGLRAVRSGAAWTVVAAPAASAAPGALPEVVVTAGNAPERADGPVYGYVAQRSATATKTDTPLLETARSISVITRDQIEIQNAQTMEQALRYTSGVDTETTGYDTRGEALLIRGFDPGESYLNGMRLPRAGTYGRWATEPYGLERIEVLKGPASVLYGQGSPGGIVNQVSKLPTAEPIREIGITAGNHDRYQVMGDVGGKLNEDGSLLYRVNGIVRKSGTQTDYIDDDRIYLAPSLTWKPSAATNLTLLADFLQDRTTRKSWFPSNSLLQTYAQGNIPVSRFVGEPDFDYYDRDAASVSVLFDHRINETWSWHTSARYAYQELDYQQVYAYALADDGRTLSRDSLASDATVRSTTLDNRAQADFSTGQARHKALFGLDYQRYSSVDDLGFGSAPTLDLFDPIYGATVTRPTTTRRYSKLDQWGFYAQDQIRIGQWIVNAGFRHDRSKTLSGTNLSAPEQKDNKTTYSSSLMYLTSSGLAPYISYATSFTPNVGTGANNSTFKPETARQFEIGAKYQPPGSNSLITASVFNLRKQNTLTDDLDNIGYSTTLGEVRSKGLEIEALANLNSQTNLLASYSHLNSLVTRSNDASELGRRPSELPKHTAKLWLDYSFAEPALQGLTIGGGIRYTSEIKNIWSDDFRIPSYTLLDAAIRYRAGNTTYSLNVSNVTNKATVWNVARFYGQARTLLATVKYNW